MVMSGRASLKSGGCEVSSPASSLSPAGCGGWGRDSAGTGGPGGEVQLLHAGLHPPLMGSQLTQLVTLGHLSPDGIILPNIQDIH